jgi:hypothetical protein
MAQIATVRVLLNTDYDDSPPSVLLIKTIAKYAPLRETTVGSGDTLDAIFVREYNFGKSDLPKSYALLKGIILEKNNLVRPEDLHPGKMVIPALPKRSNRDWGRANPLNYVANIFVYSMDTAAAATSSVNRKLPDKNAGLAAVERAASEIVYRAVKAVGEPRPNTPFAMMTLEMSPKTAVDLYESRVIPEGTLKIADFPMPARLAADARCDTEPNTHATLTEAQRNGIMQILQQSSKRSPVLFILDTGWPSADAYNESVTGVSDILKAVWDHELGATFQPTAMPQNLTAKANDGHCRCIERALKELRALDARLDARNRVRVLYIPMTREQGADGVLIDLLTTWTLLNAKAGQNAAVDKRKIDDTRKNVTDFVRKRNAFPTMWMGDEVVTDKSVLDAVLIVAQAYARITDTVFFVNESWTVRHPDYGGTYHVDYHTPQFGLVTAAAGNDGRMTLLDFAQRAPSARDTMAVLNMKQAALDETSTRMPPDAIDASMAAAFDGYVTDSVSGTSFAAPRIAWFLAAGEAVRSKEIVLGDWGWQLLDTLQRLRKPQATNYEKLSFDPVRYIGTQAGLTITGTR